MVDPDARSRGFSWVLYGLTCVLLFVRNGLRPLYVSNVTQVLIATRHQAPEALGIIDGGREGECGVA